MIDLLEEFAKFSSDPLGFVMFAFPWGEVGELESMRGPEPWQTEILEDLAKGLITPEEAIRLARTSGHGIGKSALVAWIILWAIFTFEDTKGVVTANTETQLKTKTWAELAKWYRLCLGHEFFKMTATAIFSADPMHEKTWRIDMVPWSERNTEAFAGLHNQGKRILVVMDEGSSIPDIIYEVTEGALTDKNTQIIWLVCGNPTRNKGRFRECFPGGKFAHRWNAKAIDSRSVSFTNKAQIEEWRADYGEDSDFFRVRVRGVFPRVDMESFIPYDLALEASQRVAIPSDSPLVLGVDVGRFGDDPSVIFPRKGRDATTHPVEVLYGYDTMRTASRVAAVFLRLRATMVFVDSGGVGGGVCDRLRQLNIPIVDVDFGSKAEHDDANDGAKYANKRAEIWGRMRAWLKVGAIPEKVPGVEISMLDELAAPGYGLVTRDIGECIQLESKKDMRKRGVKSPNLADALATTFAETIFEPDEFHPEDRASIITEDYNPFAGAF